MRPVLLVTATLVAVAASVTIAAATQITYDFTPPGALQTFTAPFTGQFDIISVGASGGASSVPTTPGDGATVAGFFNLTQGANLTIAVGQMGRAGINGSGGGGGGGSFVVGPLGLLEAAGGGGGAGGAADGEDGTTAEFGITGGTAPVAGGAGGTDGNGGAAGNFGAQGGGAGGGGYLSSGGTAIVLNAMGGDAMGGGAFNLPTPLIGGTGEFRPNLVCCGGDGGFGAGGGGGVGLPGFPDSGGGGGGGGYSGGGGGGPAGGGGGGGGSFISPAAIDPLLFSGVNFGDGEVEIIYQTVPEPGSVALFGFALPVLLVLRRGRPTFASDAQSPRREAGSVSVADGSASV